MKSLLCYVVVLLTTTSCSAQSGQYDLRIRLGARPRPSTAYLWRQSQGRLVVDSAHLSNGEYTFSGMAVTPFRARLVLGHKWSLPLGYDAFPFYLYLESGTIRVSSQDSLRHATLKGGPTNADYNALRPSLLPLAEQEQDAYQARNHATSKSERDHARQLYDAFQASQQQTLPPLIRQWAHSRVALDLLLDYAPALATYEDLAPLYNMLAPSIKYSSAGQALGQRIAELHETAVGRPAPPFTQPDSTGQTVALAAFRGQYVLLDFWASWCTPCRAEIPLLKATYQQYKARHFNVVSVSMDTNRYLWIQALKQESMPWKQVSDLTGLRGEPAKLYHIDGIPQNFLIGPTGTILAKNLQGDALTRKLAEVLATKP
ncbi:AhpC/TSA family protein (plasmid) [Hymenobacter sp. BRD128]|uniref:TlpA disulfide reductase family protein n=1 Tax=Hymenobacter sp. BRD128 TaxID=2675878 RepID=UPI001567826D|nr:TlpA disulfide reductase family protein [Hymenobacter sp. BRD128]QKG59143.1 AhpC/TSA family protein [Hymenobacter sp. BRD128]